ncbi:DUF3630 family protein [Filimonas effusa]|uniref:DUF3630 family protein n=1 Tax=Filimonas effusa TaxID=2508721 RepID=A0A4Q1D292_9BACT|nr:DUF3630 family protein [Filimonas effusa]RXK81175.1 DUF3630 family protein [Filimonas effusa]
MKTKYHSTLTTPTPAVIEETGTLNQFYSFTQQLSNHKKVRFTGKTDEADNIDWNFRYRGRELTLQYNIYNGISLIPHSTRGNEAVEELASTLRAR